MAVAVNRTKNLGGRFMSQATIHLAFITPCSTVVAIRKGSWGDVAGCNQVQGATASLAFTATLAL